MSRRQQSFTMPDHPNLLTELNNMSIRIKIWYQHFDKHTDPPELLEKLKANHKEPTWQEIEDLLMRAYYTINEQRHDPRHF